MSGKKTFYLIDGHAQIFRAYYAPFQLLNSPAGEPVKATHTFTQMLLSILRTRKPDYIAMALDVSDATTVRAQLYPEYKANRDETPDDFHPQVERIQQIVGLFGIPMYAIEGYEADDVIATITTQLEGQGIDTLIVSRDKDLFQLLRDDVKLWDPTKDEIIDSARVKEKHGFDAADSVEIQTLTGDSIDNIPGIVGVGPKKAAKLIEKYGNADEVLAHADELTPKMRENVVAFRDQAALTRKLVTLDRNVQFDFDLEACKTKPVPVDTLRPLCQELGFQRIVTQLDALSGTPANGAPERSVAQDRAAREGPAAPLAQADFEVEILGIGGPSASLRQVAGDYTLVNTTEAFREFLDELKQQKVFAVDTETTSLQAVDCDLVGLSFSWETNKAYYLPLRSRSGPTLALDALEKLRPTLEDPSIEKYGQNIKYDIQSLRAAGITLRGATFDSMIGSYLLYPERRSHGMDALALDLLGRATIPISELIGKGKKQISLLDVPVAQLSDYAAEDADVTWQLSTQLRPQIDASPMVSLFYDVEQPLTEVLASMEYEGIRLDAELLGAISRDMGRRLQELQDKIYQAAERPFTIDSPKQLSGILFDEIGLRVVKKTKTSRSTDAEVLTALKNESAHPLPGLVLEYRELNKLRGTYVDPLPTMVSKRTGRLHPSYHQTVAATGRLSSSDPNIQNIPIRTEQGREIRRAFIASDADHVLLCADYSQIELRILAHLAKDPALVRAFQEDQDVHASVAAEIAGIPLEAVTSEQRGSAKAINFGIIYGQGAFGLSRTLGIPQKEAADFISAYKTKYAGIVQFMASCVEQAEKTGEVATLLGRRRVIQEIHAKNRNIRALGERLAVNTVVQGTAADMIKVAMVRVHRRLEEEGLSGKLLVQVHDELVLDVPRVDVEQYLSLVREEMINAMPLDVPVRVDAAWGDNWLDAKG